jgi:hypothetical protein
MTIQPEIGAAERALLADLLDAARRDDVLRSALTDLWSTAYVAGVRHGMGGGEHTRNPFWQAELFACADCGHRHEGSGLAWICVGCPCERRTW